MEDPFQQFLVFIKDNWLSILVGFIGVVGSIASIVSYLSSKREKKFYGHVFKLVELNIDKETTEKELVLTEEQLASKKKEISTISEKIGELQRLIKRNIPIEAKRAVLEDRLDSTLEFLKKYYDDVVQIKQQLSELGEKSEIPEEVLKAVQMEIQPKYVTRERISNLKTSLTIVTSISAISLSVLPAPFDRLIGTVFLVGSAPIVLFLAKLTLTKYIKEKQPPKRTSIFVRSLFWSLMSFLIAGIFFLIEFTRKINVYERDQVGIVFSSLIFVFLVIAFLLLLFALSTKVVKSLSKTIQDERKKPMQEQESRV